MREQAREVHSQVDMAEELNRSTVYLSGLQKWLELPTYEEATYLDAYLEFFRTLVYLRTFGVGEVSLRALWIYECSERKSRSRYLQSLRSANGTDGRIK